MSTEEDESTKARPEALGECRACGNVYTVRETNDGEFRAVGTDGECACGCTDFRLVSD